VFKTSGPKLICSHSVSESFYRRDNAPWYPAHKARSTTPHFPTHYTGCPGRNVPDFWRMFRNLKYTDLTKNTYIQSWKVTEIMAKEKCGLLEVPRTVTGSRDVLSVHCACPSFSLQPAKAYSRYDCTCKVLGTLRTTATLVRVFM